MQNSAAKLRSPLQTGLDSFELYLLSSFVVQYGAKPSFSVSRQATLQWHREPRGRISGS